MKDVVEVEEATFGWLLGKGVCFHSHVRLYVVFDVMRYLAGKICRTVIVEQLSFFWLPA